MSPALEQLGITGPVALAPMAGITDLPYRDLVARFGVGLVVSEMIASREMVQARPGARVRAELGLGAERTSVQLAGREARWMGEAARMLADWGARRIDINMGCPAKKVTGGQSGSALMRTPDLALRLIESVVSVVDVPVTLKMRLGWDDSTMNAPEIAVRAESAGVRMLTVHGRTRCQLYTGRADWTAIGAVKRAVRIPVLANGDITDAAGARAALEASGADGVMIGRGAQGAPWRPARIAAALQGARVPPAPRGAAFAELVNEHYGAMLSFYGSALGLRVARKHLGWYLAGAGVPRVQCRPVLTEDDPAAVPGRVREALARAEAQAA